MASLASTLTSSISRRVVGGFALAAILFTINYAGVISGAIAPPAGYEPAWVLRNLDVPQYLTWLVASRDRILLPDYHAPWRTEPALLQPLLLIPARFHLPTLAAYYAWHFLLYWGAAIALLYAASVFCPGRERWFAIGIAACAVPFRLFGYDIAWAFHSLKWQALFAAGLLDYGYDFADGLFRGGISNSPTLTAGTMFVLLAMAILARYLETSLKKYFWMLLGLAFLSALMHPFEIFLIVASSAAPMILRRKWLDWVAIGFAGLTGLSPYLALSARSLWLRDTGELIRSNIHPFWILADFGLPCVLAAYFLLIRFRMPKSGDLVLRSWFLTAPILLLIPVVPFQAHMFNGYAYCIGFLLARRIVIDPQIMPILQKHTRRACAVFAAFVAISAAALLVLYTQVWRDGRRADPDWLLSTVRPVAERQILSWIEGNIDREALVLSPLDISPWIAALPHKSFASHDFFSITYTNQRDLADRFYRGEDVKNELLDRYGVSVVIVPANSTTFARMDAADLRTTIGPWRVYEIRGEQMKLYPGIAVLDPSAPRSIRAKVVDFISAHK